MHFNRFQAVGVPFVNAATDLCDLLEQIAHGGLIDQMYEPCLAVATEAERDLERAGRALERCQRCLLSGRVASFKHAIEALQWFCRSSQACGEWRRGRVIAKLIIAECRARLAAL